MLCRLLICITLSLGGCYEGFKRPGGGKGPGQGKTGDGGGPSEKPYGLATLDIFRPKASLITTPECGAVPSSFLEMRQNEMEARAKSVMTIVESMSDSMRVITTEISDCKTLLEADQRSQVPLSDPQVDDRLKDKPALHVRLVLWYGDRSGSFPGHLIENEWADMLRLRDLGFMRRVSVNHFAFTSDRTGGVVYSWMRFSDPPFNFTASVVVDPLPTQDGVNAVTAAVQSSAAAFADWLRQKANGGS